MLYKKKKINMYTVNDFNDCSVFISSGLVWNGNAKIFEVIGMAYFNEFTILCNLYMIYPISHLVPVYFLVFQGVPYQKVKIVKLGDERVIQINSSIITIPFAIFQVF